MMTCTWYTRLSGADISKQQSFLESLRNVLFILTAYPLILNSPFCCLSVGIYQNYENCLIQFLDKHKNSL